MHLLRCRREGGGISVIRLTVIVLSCSRLLLRVLVVDVTGQRVELLRREHGTRQQVEVGEEDGGGRGGGGGKGGRGRTALTSTHERLCSQRTPTRHTLQTQAVTPAGAAEHRGEVSSCCVAVALCVEGAFEALMGH